MKAKNLALTLVLASFSAWTQAGELPPEVLAKFVKLLSSSANSAGKVACKDGGMAGELAKLGVNADGGSKVAWAASEAEVRSLKSAGKLVLCGKLEWLPAGGAIAIVEEGGKPQIYLHMGNISASGVALSDTILKIGKKL
ncbi:MAG: hypothetical protein Q8O00_12215 [Holophaga sp.]|nr:hypothetical protein [Holophaga sp.]